MILETIETGMMQENCYLTGDRDELLVIDPGADAEKILRRIREKNYRVRYVVLTHCHYDHIGAVKVICDETGAQLVLGEKEAANYADPTINLSAVVGVTIPLRQPDRTVGEGDEILSGANRFRVLETPGHTSGGICLLCEKSLFCGDTLFYCGFGRTDFPTGSFGQLEESICGKLFRLADDVTAYCGHGEPTTIGYEKEHNMINPQKRV